MSVVPNIFSFGH